MRKLIACLLCAALPGAFAGPPDRVDCTTQISPALVRLLARDQKEDPFVVVEHIATIKFVQYAVKEGELFIDVPTSSLSADEYKRVASIFAEAGIRDPNVVSAKSVETKKDFKLSTFQLSFGSNAAAASSFGCRVLEKGLLVPASISLAMTESPE